MPLNKVFLSTQHYANPVRFDPVALYRYQIPEMMNKAKTQHSLNQKKVLLNEVNTTSATECQAISISQIILDDSNYLTFWGNIKTADGWLRCDFITNYDVLNDMLRYAGEHRDLVQMSVVQHLEDMQHIPEVVDLEAKRGDAIVFDNMLFQLSRPRLQKHGRWVEYAEGACYYITRVTPCR